ncbi:unnamed protein product, partial [Meganyctiphanes norvegica]
MDAWSERSGGSKCGSPGDGVNIMAMMSSTILTVQLIINIVNNINSNNNNNNDNNNNNNDNNNNFNENTLDATNQMNTNMNMVGGRSLHDWPEEYLSGVLSSRENNTNYKNKENETINVENKSVSFWNKSSDIIDTFGGILSLRRSPHDTFSGTLSLRKNPNECPCKKHGTYPDNSCESIFYCGIH